MLLGSWKKRIWMSNPQLKIYQFVLKLPIVTFQTPQLLVTSHLNVLQSNQQSAQVLALEYWFINRKCLFRGARARYHASQQIRGCSALTRSSSSMHRDQSLTRYQRGDYAIYITHPAKVRSRSRTQKLQLIRKNCSLPAQTQRSIISTSVCVDFVK